MHTSTIEAGPIMPSPMAGPMPPPRAESKPGLISFDSSQEFSLARLLETYKLVEREDRELKGYVFDDECLGVL